MLIDGKSLNRDALLKKIRFVARKRKNIIEEDKEGSNGDNNNNNNEQLVKENDAGSNNDDVDDDDDDDDDEYESKTELELRDLIIDQNDIELSEECINLIRLYKWETITIYCQARNSFWNLPDFIIACVSSTSNNLKHFKLIKDEQSTTTAQSYNTRRSNNNNNNNNRFSYHRSSSRSSSNMMNGGYTPFIVGHTISHGILYSTNLTKLSLCNMNLGINDDDDYNDAGGGSLLSILSKALAYTTRLEELSLAGCPLNSPSDDDDDDDTSNKVIVRTLGFALRFNQSLIKLILDGCHLADDVTSELLQSLLWHPKLSKLSLQQNVCSTLGMGMIATLLNNNKLTELDLSYLDRPPRKAKPPPSPEPEPEPEPPQEDEEQQQQPKTQEVKPKNKEENQNKKDEENQKKNQTKNDNNNRKDSDDDDDDKNRVKNTSLKKIQLAGNNFSDNYISSVLRIFGKDNALEELNLFGNRITDTGIRAIVKKLPLLTNLKYLWLGQNPFGFMACSLLVDTIKQSNSLEEVTIRALDNNTFKDEMQIEIDHYTRLNRDGRQLFGKKNDIPLSLWPIVFARSNKSYWSTAKTKSQAADIIFCLLHGPVLFSNPNLPSNK